MLKRPAARGRLATEKRPAARGRVVSRRPAVAKLCSRPQVKAPRLAFVAVRAPRAVAAGEVLFPREEPRLLAQSVRNEDHICPQPLFCAACGTPAGPLEASLALVAGRVSREELLEFARSNDGDGDGLLRWLDFASKTAILPKVPGDVEAVEPSAIFLPQVGADVVAGCGDAADEAPGFESSACFCSRSCRETWLHHGHPLRPPCAAPGAWRALAEHIAASADYAGVLNMAVDIMALSAWPRGEVQRPRAVTEALRPLLCLDSRRKLPDGVPRQVVTKTHRLLLRTRFEAPAMAGSKAALRQIVLAAAPLNMFERVVSVLDSYSWGLNGSNMPSALGKYCEAMSRDDVSPASKAEVGSAMGPVLKALCEQQDMLDTDSAEESETPEAGVEDAGEIDNASSAVPLPSVETARGMAPVLLKQLLTDDEIALVRSVSEKCVSAEHAKHASNGAPSSSWRTRYLHAGGAFRREAPELLDKLINAAVAADARPGGWGLIRNGAAASLRPRVIEHHLVGPGGALPDPTHFDGGSVVTLDVMLKEPGRDFEGGDFTTVEADGRSVKHAFGKGDALVFVSHKPHCVHPVRTGHREVMVLELWEGEERRCDHRCQHPRGTCPIEAASDAFPRGQKRSREDECLGDGAGNEALGLTLQDAGGAFAATAFEGAAFFERVGQIMAQSDAQRRAVARNHAAARAAEPNVEVTFEEVAPVAIVRALRHILLGELLVAKPCNEEEEPMDGEGSDEAESGGDDAENAEL